MERKCEKAPTVHYVVLLPFVWCPFQGGTSPCPLNIFCQHIAVLFVNCINVLRSVALVEVLTFWSFSFGSLNRQFKLDACALPLLAGCVNQQNNGDVGPSLQSLDIWLSPNMCVIVGEIQFVALLRSAWEKYKCLTVQITCESPQ